MNYAQLYIENKHDRDWLQRNAELAQCRVPFLGLSRAEGKTFSILMLMLGEAELGDPGNTYIYVGPNHHCVRVVQAEFAAMLQHDKHTITTFSNTNSLVTIHKPGYDVDQRFFFLPVGHQLYNRVRGIHVDRVFVDLSVELCDEYRRELDELFAREVY